ncbi:MAG: hypothetical protein C4576_27925 [Desulfobacteraceae bacterium]|nr:MAG: hypothetical protein C4576_27925 [Desulfobacteraceae bacterium]
MKVYENPGLILNQIRKQNTVKDQGESSFRQVMEDVGLEKELQGKGQGQSASGIIPEGVQIISRTGSTQSSEKGFQKEEILRNLEQTFDLIDFYAGRLADPSFQTGEMEPLIENLEERLAGFQTLQSEQELPEQLNTILSDVILTLGKETARFRRGDYT